MSTFLDVYIIVTDRLIFEHIFVGSYDELFGYPEDMRVLRRKSTKYGCWVCTATRLTGCDDQTWLVCKTSPNSLHKGDELPGSHSIPLWTYNDESIAPVQIVLGWLKGMRLITLFVIQCIGIIRHVCFVEINYRSLITFLLQLTLQPSSNTNTLAVRTSATTYD